MVFRSSRQRRVVMAKMMNKRNFFFIVRDKKRGNIREFKTKSPAIKQFRKTHPVKRFRIISIRKRRSFRG